MIYKQENFLKKGIFTSTSGLRFVLSDNTAKSITNSLKDLPVYYETDYGSQIKNICGRVIEAKETDSGIDLLVDMNEMFKEALVEGTGYNIGAAYSIGSSYSGFPSGPVEPVEPYEILGVVDLLVHPDIAIEGGDPMTESEYTELS